MVCGCECGALACEGVWCVVVDKGGETRLTLCAHPGMRGWLCMWSALYWYGEDVLCLCDVYLGGVVLVGGSLNICDHRQRFVFGGVGGVRDACVDDGDVDKC